MASDIANAMASGHTTGVVRVRSLTVVVMRHCFDDLAETESAKVCEAFTATYVPLISSAASLRFFSSITLEMPGSPVSGSTARSVHVGVGIAGTDAIGDDGNLAALGRADAHGKPIIEILAQ